MHTDIKANSSPARNACCPPRPRRPQWLRLTVLAAGIACGASSQAIEFGPFKLTGFAKAEFTRVTPYCPASDCQVADPRFTVREFQWADAIASGKSYGPGTTHVTLFQPWLEAKFDIGRGFKLSGLLSQRYRDGKIDLPGFVYEKNVAISHEDYGRLAVGAMTSRSWSVADYPYGTNIGLADVWGSSGAGYGLLGHAVRYTSRIFDVLEGDLVLEATYDRGNRDFKIHKPWFYELYAQFHKGDLVIDAMYQDSRNGGAVAWGHAPFSGPFYDVAADAKVGTAGQTMAMAMARYEVNPRLEVTGGIRHNRWSGMSAVIVKSEPRFDTWNWPFNVDWNGKLVYTNADGSKYIVDNPGYPVYSTDVMGGLRYRFAGNWIVHTGVAYLGKGHTKNPSERGQSNSALVNTVGLNYDFKNGLQLYGMAGMIHYDHKGLAPISIPSHSSFTNVDSRVSKQGNWFGVGAVFVF